MKTGLFILVTAWEVLIVTTVLGHNPAETHTLIRLDEDRLTVDIELPWTINEAARLYYQIQEGNLVSDEATQNYLRSYVLDHLHFFQAERPVLPVKMEEIPLDHGHSIKYELIYPIETGVSIEVVNNCMLELFTDLQKNYVVVENSKIFQFEKLLNENQCELIIPEKSPGRLRSIWDRLFLMFFLIWW